MATSIHDGSFPRRVGLVSPEDSHPMPLTVAIVGAGIGGLTAAIGLRRNGHQVHLFEQSDFASEVGASVHLAPNSNGILRRWGIFAEEFGANTMDSMIEYTQQGQIRRVIPLVTANKRWQHPWHLVHRVNLHDRLKHFATIDNGAGPLAILHASSKVVTINPEKGEITLENGRKFTADIVLGADGIYSTSRDNIKKTEPFSSGKAAFRFLIPRSVAEADSVTAPLVERENSLLMWYGDDRRIVVYPCNNNRLLNFICIHPDTESHAAQGDGWNKRGSIEQVLKVYQDFDPTVKALISKVDTSILKVWRLLDMEKLPTWTSGKLALLGDAAHPFTPHQGQGASQAIEDAAALSIVLPTETAPEEITERLELYEKIRYERAHTIQEYSRLAGMDWKDGKPAVDMMAFTNYNFGHDEIDHATNIFKRWKWTKTPKINMYWRMPIGFGPIPGPSPHQDEETSYRHHRQFIAASSTPEKQFITITVIFKTSRTFLETVFPTAQFQFKSPDTVATASFSATRVDNPTGCRNSGQASQLGLYIHNVQYVKKDGTIIDGSYLPVIFSSESASALPDSSLSTPEHEFDAVLPKILCDIDISHDNDTTFSLTTSHHGQEFIRITLSNLTLKSDQEETNINTSTGIPSDTDTKLDDSQFEPATNILTYRYFPSTSPAGNPDQPGITDPTHEYACMIPITAAGHNASGCVLHNLLPQKTHADAVYNLAADSTACQTQEHVRIKIEAGDWDSLPTMHHVTSVLADMPVYEVVGARVVKGRWTETGTGTAVAGDGSLWRRIG